MFLFRSEWEPAPRCAPAGLTLFAVGDVHGCVDQFDGMLAVLANAMDEVRRQGRRSELIMLGDYVDRGPDSPAVLRRLPDLAARYGEDVKVHLLRGNHDQFLLDHLRVMPHPGTLEIWLLNGGLHVLEQLGLAVPEFLDSDDARDLAALSTSLRAAFGPQIVATLRGLSAFAAIGDYVFVHAGIRPDLPLDEQSEDDLLWIREPFLEARTWPHPFAVVHGHTPLGPEVLPHRIGVDGGCFFTGVLTAVEIAEQGLRFYAVSTDPEPTEFWRLIRASGQDRTFSGPERLDCV